MVYTKFLKEKYQERESEKPGDPIRRGPAEPVNRKMDVDRNGNFDNTPLLITGLVFGLVLITFAVVKLRKR